MTRWLISIAAAVVAIAAGYLVVLNPDAVAVHLRPGRTVNPPLAGALLAAFAAGVFVAGLLASARAGAHGWRSWRERRVARRAARHAAGTARARDLLWTGHVEQARAALVGRREELPGDAQRLALLAETYLRENDASGARRLLEQGMTRTGLEPRLLDLLAEAAEHLGDLRAAAEALERARLGEPDSPRLARRLRDVYVAGGRWEDALAVQGQILLRVRGRTALAAEQAVLRGLRYQASLSDPDARRAGRRLIAVAREDPGFVPAWVSAGDVFAGAGRTFAARRAWERGVRHRPAVVLLERLERLNTNTRRPERTTRLYRRLQRRHPDAAALPLLLARHLISENRLEQAAGVLEGLSDALASSPFALTLWAELARRQGHHERAAELFARAAGPRLGLDAPFRCTICRRHSETWERYCPRCRRWDTVRARVELSE